MFVCVGRSEGGDACGVCCGAVRCGVVVWCLWCVVCVCGDRCVCNVWAACAVSCVVLFCVCATKSIHVDRRTTLRQGKKKHMQGKEHKNE